MYRCIRENELKCFIAIRKAMYGTIEKQGEVVQRLLITGSNRGLGLEFTRQYLESGWRVYATCRKPAEAQSLSRLAKLHSNLSIHRLDITLQEDLYSLRQELKEISLDILINNAGVYFKNRSRGIECVHYDDWRRTIEVNTLGTVRVTEALLDSIAKNEGVRLVVVISSHMGSISDISEPGSIYYRSSKAALNAAMQCVASALRQRNIGVLLLHPGGVMTRMGPDKGISKQESVGGMRRIIENFSMEKSGAFFQYDGQELRW
ncbi:MAG: SDR family oxidoreductase [Desulforhopalus sp.]